VIEMIKATKLRQNLYRILDEILESGVPVEIERNGRVLKIVPEKANKLGNLERHEVINGNPEELVHLDWTDEWKEGE
jgi:antitoxin (DNA-binding transcriptional repressor) of toxin-antitoxin stability system